MIVARMLVAFASVALVAVGCYSLAEPSLRPGDSRDVLAALTRRGVGARTIAVGETGCDDPGLVANAIRLTVTSPDGDGPRDVYLYLFRVKSWEASQAAVDACQATYGSAHPGVRVSRVDVPTYRAFGADWSAGLEQAVRGALEEASQLG